jgi:hypothetical protein
MPANDERLLILDMSGAGIGNTDVLMIRGKDRAIMNDTAWAQQEDSMGQLWTVPARNVCTRYTIMTHEKSDDEWNIGADGTIAVNITPRSRHLLGTL